MALRNIQEHETFEIGEKVFVNGLPRELRVVELGDATRPGRKAGYDEAGKFVAGELTEGLNHRSVKVADSFGNVEWRWASELVTDRDKALAPPQRRDELDAMRSENDDLRARVAALEARIG